MLVRNYEGSETYESAVEDYDGGIEVDFFKRGAMTWLQPASRRTISISHNNDIHRYFVSLPQMVFVARYGISLKPTKNPDTHFVWRTKLKAGFIKEWPCSKVYRLPFPNTYIDVSVCLGSGNKTRHRRELTLEQLMKDCIGEFWSIPFRLGEVDDNWGIILRTKMSLGSVLEKHMFSYLQGCSERTRSDPNYVMSVEEPFSIPYDEFL